MASSTLRGGLLAGVAVGHTTRQIGNGRKEPAAIFLGERLDYDRIFRLSAFEFLTASMNRTSFRTYTGLIGRRKGTVRISRWDA